MTTGTVRWFDEAKGFGFIECDSLDSDVFVHFSSINGEGYRSLNEGERVSFEVSQDQKGLQASNVTKL